MKGQIVRHEVREHFVFNDQKQVPAANSIFYGPITKMTANDIIGLEGPRNPGYDTSIKKFKIATIIVSSNLLSDLEMSFYDYFSARAELKEVVDAREGFHLYASKPFYLSTGGKGEIVSTLDR